MGIFQLPRCCTPTLLAKIATMFATCAWGVQVLHDKQVLDPVRYPVYSDMLSIMPEDWWAAGGICTSLLGALTQVTGLKDRWIESAIFSLMALFWTYLAASAWYFYPTLPPTGWPCVITVVGLSIFAAASKDHRRGPAA